MRLVLCPTLINLAINKIGDKPFAGNFFIAKLIAMTEKSKGGPRQGAGRPPGTGTTEATDFVARLREATGETQIDFAARLAIPYSTLRSYEKRELIPKSGPVRDVLIADGARVGVKL